ncbi:hypothetical protein SAMN04487897_103330 [Paenibacillus sp. yr247]|uniref:hypothetical protein n=1 Tax=Paenibacillus sp. yr247 TaxID=1761880 RepID=UPI00087FF498|nr:hypothetical protein [Paenibacillus sp. yr247]SDN60962.1 hypothetical protein SAMN04487897_103330 [Paenibacillus sp. yr247]
MNQKHLENAEDSTIKELIMRFLIDDDYFGELSHQSIRPPKASYFCKRHNGERVSVIQINQIFNLHKNLYGAIEKLISYHISVYTKNKYESVIKQHRFATADARVYLIFEKEVLNTLRKKKK